MIDKFKTMRAEIKAVGLKDWWWFTVYLDRDEFSDKLSVQNYTKKYTGKDGVKRIYYDHQQLLKDRQRAHHIDLKLMEIK